MQTTGKPSESPIVPQGGWTKADNIGRCERCGEISSEGRVGTVLASTRISLKNENGPSVDLAWIDNCYKCGWIRGIRIIHGLQEIIDGQETGRKLPGEADKLGINEVQIKNAYRSTHSSLLTIDDFKHKSYNSNRYIEPKETEEI